MGLVIGAGGAVIIDLRNAPGIGPGGGVVDMIFIVVVLDWSPRPVGSSGGDVGGGSGVGVGIGVWVGVGVDDGVAVLVLLVVLVDLVHERFELQWKD